MQKHDGSEKQDRPANPAGWGDRFGSAEDGWSRHVLPIEQAGPVWIRGLVIR